MFHSTSGHPTKVVDDNFLLICLSQFRSLNQELYTQPSTASFARFVADPKLFDVYHCGFREQVREGLLFVLLMWL